MMRLCGHKGVEISIQNSGPRNSERRGPLRDIFIAIIEMDFEGTRCEVYTGCF
jgi:hypothetical protein